MTGICYMSAGVSNHRWGEKLAKGKANHLKYQHWNVFYKSCHHCIFSSDQKLVLTLYIVQWNFAFTTKDRIHAFNVPSFFVIICRFK